VTGSNIELDLNPPVATLRLNRPDRANALNRRMVSDFADCVTELARRDDLAVLLLCGAGSKFSAGGDLKELAQHSHLSGTAFELALADACERLAALPMIVVALIERFALGGGFLISLYCDLRIATPDAMLGFTPVARNWVPPWGLSRLAAWLGPARAQQFLLVRGSVTAEEALSLGLVDRVIVDHEMDDYIARTTPDWLAVPRDVVREVKTFYAQWKGVPHARGDRLSAAAFARTFGQPAARRALAEFIQPDRPKDVTQP
jgi:enoyl-CoA hydratase/carnithine racemase